MNAQQSHNERGQALVTVVISLVVLLLFAGLAIDVGHMYAERRHMQNAADAGALAGARQMCLGYTSMITSTAREYAQTRNGALTATTTISGNIVIVTATIPVVSFFARLVGITSTDVHAVAKAACGSATEGCGLFPLAFNINNWNDIPCGEKFLVWADDNYTAPDALCTSCDCLGKFHAYVYSGHEQIGTGNRGWLLLPVPEAPYPSNFPQNCGSCGSSVDCWITYDWPGQVHINECVPNKAGIVNSNLLATATRINEIVRVVLWDRSLSCTDTLGACGSDGSDYPVAGFGCIQIEQVYNSQTSLTMNKLPVDQQGPNYDPTYDCPTNKKAILVTKLCSCPLTACGATSGTPRPNGGVGAVSLVP
ncbi:MAG: pilus assembly protein TadG-related protein [Anaerolineae bacterium]